MRTLLAIAALALLMGAPNARAERVVLISVDGLRPDAITPETAPNIVALRATGTAAREALAALPPITLPSHASMLTGLTVQRHGLLLDFDLPGTIPQPTVFDFAHDAGLRTAFFASKTKMSFLAHPDASETIDIDPDPTAIVARLLPLIATDGPDLIFLHLRDPDSTGHRSGWMSPEYLAAVTRMDALIGQVADAITADAERPTYLIITADHGGRGHGHLLNKPVNRHIPWIAIGPGIPAGAELPDTVSTTDTTPTVLWLLGVPIPDGLSGRARTELRETPPVGTGNTAPSVPPVGPPCFLVALPLLVLFCFAAARVPRAWYTRSA